MPNHRRRKWFAHVNKRAKRPLLLNPVFVAGPRLEGRALRPREERALRRGKRVGELAASERLHEHRVVAELPRPLAVMTHAVRASVGRRDDDGDALAREAIQRRTLEDDRLVDLEVRPEGARVE
jgi:hypothetical protein